MPSGITHMLLSRFVIDRVADEAEPIVAAVLRSEPGAFLIGSVAPDLPYMSDLDLKLFKSHKLVADDLHYRVTDLVPIRGMTEARAIVEGGGPIDQARALYAFYIGYCSHLVADGLVHPFVRDKVGDYDVAAKAHRVLEMELDVLLARKLLNMEVNGLEFEDEQKWISDSHFKSQILASFSRQINSVYPHHKVIPADVGGWISTMQTVFGAAEGQFPRWYRSLLGDQGIAFKDYSDLISESDEILTLRMPKDAEQKGLTSNFMKKDTVHFFDDVIMRYFDRFPEVIVAGYDWVFNGKVPDRSLVPAIDLDNGRLLLANNLAEMPALWV